MTPSKTCPVCGESFDRRPGLSAAQWDGQKTCGHQCGAVLSWANRHPRSLADRFTEKVNTTPGLGPNGDCWEWTGSLNNKGYGQIGLGRRNDGLALAHRVAWLLHYNRWPHPLALHRCDNPKCVRVDHLFEGTQADNIRDAAQKGRL